MKRNLLLVAFATLLLAPSCDFIRSNNPFTKKSRDIALQKQIDSIRISDSLRVSNALAARLKARQDSIDAADAARAYEESFKYHIIVGSFITPENAQNYSEYYSGKGYPTKVIDMANSRFKLVSVKSFKTVNEAYTALKDIRDNIEYDAWVYVND